MPPEQRGPFAYASHGNEAVMADGSTRAPRDVRAPTHRKAGPRAADVSNVPGQCRLA